ncbi:MAG: hypothetical protein Ta2F_08340 [Termitinemataceae bacterium]|nr:MAG: hypothetical protein Ta2F_08340 [Termitinemataceae bacterium]
MGLGDFWYNIKWALSSAFEKLLKQLKKITADNKQIVFQIKIAGIIFAALLVVTVLVTVLVVKKHNSQKKVIPVFNVERITEDQLFIPDEPDFLPDVILENEQKKNWTKEDAKKFWTDPATYPAEVWQDKISGAVDKLLERIP